MVVDPLRYVNMVSLLYINGREKINGGGMSAIAARICLYQRIESIFNTSLTNCQSFILLTCDDVISNMCPLLAD